MKKLLDVSKTMNPNLNFNFFSSFVELVQILVELA